MAGAPPQVLVDEAEDLQGPLLQLLAPFFRTIGLRLHQSRPAVSEPGLQGIIDGQAVLMAEFKTDAGGNTRAQLEVGSAHQGERTRAT